MSRAGTLTDNAATESINGWIKSELFMDFHVTGEPSVEQEVAAYITFQYCTACIRLAVPNAAAVQGGVYASASFGIDAGDVS